MKRHSLLFGVQDYPDTGSLTPLKCPHADVDALAEILGDPRYMGEVGQVVGSKDATYPEAQKIFGNFLRQVGREDVAIIHFSGHGVRDDDGDLYLCFRDAVETELHFTALNVKTFRDWLEKQKLRRMLITLDCCHSAAAGAQMTRSSVAAPLKRAERPLPDGTGLYILASADATETAKEANGRGVFSHHLVEGIRTGAADSDHDGRITVAEIAEYLHREVPKDAAQTPFMTGHRTSGTFLIARNPVALEEIAARKAAEEVAAAKAEREATLAAGLAKLKKHASEYDTFSLHFAGGVERWIVRARAALVAGPQFDLLARFVQGELSAVEFHDAWQEAEKSTRLEPREQRSAGRDGTKQERTEEDDATQKVEQIRANQGKVLHATTAQATWEWAARAKTQRPDRMVRQEGVAKQYSEEREQREASTHEWIATKADQT